MKEITSKPLASGTVLSPSITSSRGRTVSDVAIAEQFCIVATDMRSILQALRVSNEIQKSTVESIQSNSNKLDVVVDKLNTMVDQLSVLADHVKKSDETVKSAVEENQKHIDTLHTFLEMLEKHVDNLGESSTLMARSLLEDGAYTTLVNKIREEKNLSK